MKLYPVWVFGKQAWSEAFQVSCRLFKIMIPILIGVKILQESGLIVYLAKPLNPVMQLMGLPGETGLIWATAMVNNLYSGMIVFLTLADSMQLTVAQVTVLSTAMLVAHALPIEVKIAQSAGTRFVFQALSRIGGGFVLGWLLHQLYSLTGWLQGPNVIFWQGEVPTHPNLWSWALNQATNLGLIFLIILALVLLMRIMHRLRIVDALIWLLRPVLHFLGIGREAATLTIIGMVMGLTYGGGLIIQESKSGQVAPQDVFSSLTLMGLTHSLIEDTLLLSLLGAHMSGILWGRLVFSLLAVALLVRLLPLLPQKVVHRFLFVGRVQGTAASRG
jgi:spore maturation protein SpmB